MKLLRRIKYFINSLRPIRMPKGFKLNGNPAGKVSRQMKRRATIIVNGKETNVLQYMFEQARTLPPMLIADTNEKVDHYGCLKLMYMEYGIDGVNKYLQHVKRCFKKTAKPSRIRRKYNQLRKQREIVPCSQLN